VEAEKANKGKPKVRENESHPGFFDEQLGSAVRAID
jgi:hypothetical protein